MESAKASAVHHLIRAVLLFGLAAYILYLVKSGNLVYYIAPRMENYVKYAAIGLYAAAVYKAYAGIRSLRSAEPSCDCGHPASRSAFKNAVGYGLFALPLLLGFLLPDTALSSAAAAKKGMNLSANTAVHSGAKQTKGQSVPSAAPGASPAALSPSVQPSESSHPSPSADPSAQGNNNVGAVNDDELKRMFAPPDEFSGDLSKIGMILYRQDKIKVAPEAFM